MATINTTDPKPGYVYNQDDDTWYPLLGIANAQALSELSDVSLSTPTTGQVLSYDGTNWVNSSEAGDISSVTAGTGLSGGGSSGAVTLSLDTAVAATTNNTLTMSGKTLTKPIFTSPMETVSATTSAPTATQTFDMNTAETFLFTGSSTSNMTFNFRGDGSTTLNSILSNGQSATFAVMITNGATAYYPTVFQVDGNAVTPKWQGGTAPSAGNASSIDAYVFNIIKTASATFTILASQTKFA